MLTKLRKRLRIEDNFMSFSEIIAYGHYLPETFLKNEDLKKFVDTSDEWIFSRTGIRQRHIAKKKRTNISFSN